MVTKGFASCNTLISDWPKYSLTIHSPCTPQSINLVFNKIQSAKNLRILILLNMQCSRMAADFLSGKSSLAKRRRDFTTEYANEPVKTGGVGVNVHSDVAF